jgi:hypothetical protein
MQAYVPADTARPFQLRVLEPSSPAAAATGAGVLDELLGQLADLVADRVAMRLAAPRRGAQDEWLDTRRPAEYLGIHRDTLRRLAAERVIPTEQAAAGLQALLQALRSGFVALFWPYLTRERGAVIGMAESDAPRRVRVERGNLSPTDRRPGGRLQG